MKTIMTAIALLTLNLPQAFALAPPAPNAKAIFELFSGSFLSPTARHVQIREDGSVHLIETARNSQETHEVDLAFLDERSLLDAMAAVAIVKPGMDFRALTKAEQERTKFCAMDSSISYWVSGARFQNDRKIVIKELGCGLELGLANVAAAQAMQSLKAIVDKALQDYANHMMGQ